MPDLTAKLRDFLQSGLSRVIVEGATSQAAVPAGTRVAKSRVYRSLTDDGLCRLETRIGLQSCLQA
jgi:hypothetical protein